MAAREHGSKTGSGFISAQQEVSLSEILFSWWCMALQYLQYPVATANHHARSAF